MRCKQSIGSALWNLLACVALASGCGGSADNHADATPQDPTAIIPPNFQPESAPEGVDPALWNMLTDELERQLAAWPAKTASTPPCSLLSRTTLKLTGGQQLNWGYYSQGDYDQNGEVNASDLVPLAKHFHESALPNRFPADSVQAVVDGDANGEINLADVTPIAVNFRNIVDEYRLYTSLDNADYPGEFPDRDNGDAELESVVALAMATGNANQERLQLRHNLPEIRDGDMLWVRPADSEGEGIASNAIGPLHPAGFTVSGYILTEWGAPVQGVAVGISGDGTGLTMTDASGYWQLDNLANGSYLATPGLSNWRFVNENASFEIAGEDVALPAFTGIELVVSLSWGTASNEGVNDLAIDTTGNVYAISGYDYDSELDLSDVILLKYGDSYELEWAKSWDYGDNGYAEQVEVDTQGNIVVLAHTELEIDGNPTTILALLKFSPSGALLFQRRWIGYGFSVGLSSFNRLSIAPDNSYIIATTNVTDSVDDEEQAIVIKVRQDGGVQWQWKYEYEENRLNTFMPTGLDVEGNGRIALCAIASGSVPVQTFGLVMNLDPEGELIWAKTHRTSSQYESELPYSIAWGAANSIFMVSILSDNGLFVPEQRMRRLNTDGTLAWTSAWENAGLTPVPFTIAIVKDGSIVSVGDIILTWSVSGSVSGSAIWLPQSQFHAAEIDNRHALIIGGATANAEGNLQTVGGTTYPRIVIVENCTILRQPVLGVISNAAGQLAVPDGVNNSGGGGSDMHLVWIRD